MIVKLEICRLLRISHPEIEIGFVPDFEVPLLDFINAVAVHQVLGELVNQVVPFVPIFRRRNVLLVPEGMRRILRRQFLGHEAQLNKRTHPILQKTVIGLVHIREVVNRAPALSSSYDAHFVEKNGMEANVFHFSGLLHLAQILAIAFTHTQAGASRSKHVLPEMREGMGRCAGIDRSQHFGLARGGLSHRDRKKTPESWTTPAKADCGGT